MNLENKRILVTGGAKRVGRMFVEKFQSLGCEVVVHCNKSEDEAKIVEICNTKRFVSTK